MQKQTRGFTIVELVVVIVVIAIIATISVVGYGTWRSGLSSKEVQSDLSGVAASMKDTQNWDDDGYPTFADNTVFTSSSPSASVFKPSDGVTLTYRWGSEDYFCFEALSASQPSVTYYLTSISDMNGARIGTCPTEPITESFVAPVVTTLVSGGLSSPTGIAIDSAGNLFVAETGLHRIIKVTTAGVVTTFAGGNTPGSTNGTGTAAKFNLPYGLAIDAADNIYVVDHGNDRIRMITPGGVVSYYAGSGVAGSANGTGTAAQFNDPYGIAYEASTGNLYVTETANHRVRKITSSAVVSTMAGGSQGYVDANGTSARFSDPVGVAVHSGGLVYIVETGNDKVRRMATDATVTTFVGGNTGFADGVGTAARFNDPTGIGIYNDLAFVADSANNRVRRINLYTGLVSTFAGSGASGDSDGTGVNAEFDNPTGIAVGSTGIVYIVETDSGQIRRIQQ